MVAPWIPYASVLQNIGIEKKGFCLYHGLTLVELGRTENA